MVSGADDSFLFDLPDAQLSLLSKPGDFGDFVFDRSAAGDVILMSLCVQQPLQPSSATLHDNAGVK